MLNHVNYLNHLNHLKSYFIDRNRITIGDNRHMIMISVTYANNQWHCSQHPNVAACEHIKYVWLTQEFASIVNAKPLEALEDALRVTETA
jgi:hypothetical protein